MSLSPKDMDFLEAKHTAAREIALAFGVPPMLLGIPGDNTYANYPRPTACSGARPCCRWRSASARAIAQWLQPAFGEVVRAVARHRPHRGAGRRPRSLWGGVSAAPFLTLTRSAKRWAMEGRVEHRSAEAMVIRRAGNTNDSSFSFKRVHRCRLRMRPFK